MKFMFMIYHDENVLDAMPEKEMQARVDSAIEYAEEIQRSGHYIVSDALQRALTARTIRVRAGKVSTTARPGACVRDHRASAGGAPARPPYVLATRNGRRARPGRARDWPRPPPCLSQALRAPVTRARATYRFLGKVWVNERG